MSVCCTEGVGVLCVAPNLGLAWRELLVDLGVAALLRGLVARLPVVAGVPLLLEVEARDDGDREGLL